MYLFVFFLSLMLYTSFGHAVLYFSPNVQVGGPAACFLLAKVLERRGWLAACLPGRVGSCTCNPQAMLPSLVDVLQAAQGLGATILVVLDIFKGAVCFSLLLPAEARACLTSPVFGPVSQQQPLRTSGCISLLAATACNPSVWPDGVREVQLPANTSALPPCFTQALCCRATRWAGGGAGSGELPRC